MKIIRQEENYIKVELENGQILIIDESDKEYNLKAEGFAETSISVYKSNDKYDLYTPLATIAVGPDYANTEKPEPYMQDGKIMCTVPEDLFEQTSKEFWSSIREQRKS